MKLMMTIMMMMMMMISIMSVMVMMWMEIMTIAKCYRGNEYSYGKDYSDECNDKSNIDLHQVNRHINHNHTLKQHIYMLYQINGRINNYHIRIHLQITLNSPIDNFMEKYSWMICKSNSEVWHRTIHIDLYIKFI